MTGYAFTENQMEKIESFYGSKPETFFDVSEAGQTRKNKVTFTARHENSPIQLKKETRATETGYTLALPKEDGWEWYEYDSFEEMMVKARKIQRNMDRYV